MGVPRSRQGGPRVRGHLGVARWSTRQHVPSCSVPLSRAGGGGRQGPRNVCYTPSQPGWPGDGPRASQPKPRLVLASGTCFSQRSCRETWVLCLRSCPVLKGRAHMRSLCSRLLLSTESRLLSQTDPLPQAQCSPALPSAICPQSWGSAPRKPGPTRALLHQAVGAAPRMPGGASAWWGTWS